MQIIVEGFGKSIAKRDNQIVIKENGKEIEYFLAKDINQILLTGKGSITFDALNLLSKYDVTCLSLDWKGHVDYLLSPADKKNSIIKKEQYFALKDSRSGKLSKAFIEAKIKNQKATLGTMNKSRPEVNLDESRIKLNENLKKVNELPNKPSEMIRGKLLGLEGNSSQEYWNGIKQAINEKWGFEKRSGRNAKDPINSMLNYGYGILQGEVWKNILIAGLDPYCGYLHTERYGRVSLVFDIMEEYRQQIVDKSVFGIMNRNQLKKEDFKFEKGTILISDKARKLLISKILKKLNTKIQYQNKQLSYSKIILRQTQSLCQFLKGNEKYEGFSLRW